MDMDEYLNDRMMEEMDSYYTEWFETNVIGNVEDWKPIGILDALEIDEAES